jgi:hypothetical protein
MKQKAEAKPRQLGKVARARQQCGVAKRPAHAVGQGCTQAGVRTSFPSPGEVQWSLLERGATSSVKTVTRLVTQVQRAVMPDTGSDYLTDESPTTSPPHLGGVNANYKLESEKRTSRVGGGNSISAGPSLRDGSKAGVVRVHRMKG